MPAANGTPQVIIGQEGQEEGAALLLIGSLLMCFKIFWGGKSCSLPANSVCLSIQGLHPSKCAPSPKVPFMAFLKVGSLRFPVEV